MLAERAAAGYAPANERPMAYYERSVPTALFTPGFTFKDMWDASYGGLYSLGVLTPQMNAFDARRVSVSFKVPMFFFQGARDSITPTSLVETYMSEITAPHKELVILEGNGHGALVTDPNQFLRALGCRNTVRDATSLPRKGSRPVSGRGASLVAQIRSCRSVR
jgi:pimeloyl-ACP methyl ester carboxylesterase